jgi:AraC-like DNA-binding protein
VWANRPASTANGPNFSTYPIWISTIRATLLDLLHSEPPLAEGAAVTAEQRKKIARLVVSIHAAPDRLPRVSEMARELHWSPAHFSRIFKIVTQQSPRDFLLEVRLSRARHLLAETSLAVGEIAERLDYADLFFFSRQFKAKSGLSPLQYRQQKARQEKSTP